jgi:hypothetical protein
VRFLPKVDVQIIASVIAGSRAFNAPSHGQSLKIIGQPSPHQGSESTLKLLHTLPLNELT